MGLLLVQVQHGIEIFLCVEIPLSLDDIFNPQWNGRPSRLSLSLAADSSSAIGMEWAGTERNCIYVRFTGK